MTDDAHASGPTDRRANPARSDLDPLLEPDSVAIVGASPDAWYAGRLIDNLLEYGYDGEVYFVNPGRDEVFDRPCYDTITDVPEVVDLAVVSIPREPAVEVVREAADAGVSAALIITAGFAEADERGRELQAELAAIADATGIRVCGPNTIGYASMYAETVLTATCSRRPVPGRIGLVSHSGALAFTTFYERATDEDVRFSHIVATGNEADQTLTDYVEYLAADDRVDVICCYIEGLADPRRFTHVAARAVLDGTPVLAVKVGRSADAEAATLSHTGSMTGNDDVWDAALAQAGVQRVSDVPDLVGLASAHGHYDPPTGDRICVLSTSGGLASLLADFVSERGLELPALADETEQALLDMEELLTFGSLPNPVDIRGYGSYVLEDIAELMLADDSFDGYLVAIGMSAVDEHARDIAADLERIVEGADAPIVVCWTGRKEAGELDDPQPYEALRSAIPLFYDPERAVEALASLVAARDARRTVREPLALPDPVDDDLPSDAVLDWTAAADLLGAYGIEPVESRVVEDAEAAADAAETLGFPVVMKVDAPEVAHRDRVGGVVLDVGDPAAVRSAYHRIVENVEAAQPGVDATRLVVQSQVADGTEALVGTTIDPGFGPVLAVGSGGGLVEVLGDRALRLAPARREDAADAIEATALGEQLDRDDRAALAELAAAASRLAAERSVAELDLNPVIVRDGTCHVVDVLVRTT